MNHADLKFKIDGIWGPHKTSWISPVATSFSSNIISSLKSTIDRQALLVSNFKNQSLSIVDQANVLLEAMNIGG